MYFMGKFGVNIFEGFKKWLQRQDLEMFVDSDTVKEQMRLLANTFLTHRQIGEAEAIYRLLPNMILKNSNIGCQWL